MIEHRTKFRVRYAETDRMGFVYYGNYATYFEVGRVELLRSLGVAYKDIEDSGVLLPVRDMNVRYIKPAKYDEVLTLHTRLVDVPSARIVFLYALYNEGGDLLTTAEITLVFVDKTTERPVSAPPNVLRTIRVAFDT